MSAPRRLVRDDDERAADEISLYDEKQRNALYLGRCLERALMEEEANAHWWDGFAAGAMLGALATFVAMLIAGRAL